MDSNNNNNFPNPSQGFFSSQQSSSNQFTNQQQPNYSNEFLLQMVMQQEMRIRQLEQQISQSRPVQTEAMSEQVVSPSTLVDRALRSRSGMGEQQQQQDGT